MWEKETDLNMAIFRFLVILLAVSGVVSLLLMISLYQPNQHSAIYLRAESYANYLVEGKTTVIFGITNNTPQDAVYSVDFYFGKEAISRKHYSLEANSGKEFKEVLQVTEEKILRPDKINLSLSKEGEFLASVFYWVKPAPQTAA